MEKTTESLFCLPCDLNAWKTNLPLSAHFEFVIGSLTNLPPDQTTDWRAMPFHFCCIPEQDSEESCKCLEISGRDTIYVKRGEFVFVPAGVRHRVSEIGSIPVRSCLWMHFRCTVFGDMDILNTCQIPFWLPAEETTLLNQLLRELIQLPSTLDLSQSVHQQLLGNAFVLELLRHSTPREYVEDMTKKSANIIAIRHVLSVIEKSPDPLPNEQLAKEANLSLSRFMAVFREITGTSPKRYQEQKRFRKACDLLLFSPFQVREIAEKLGFYDAYHFSRIFKQKTGFTPSEYRKNGNII